MNAAHAGMLSHLANVSKPSLRFIDMEHLLWPRATFSPPCASAWLTLLYTPRLLFGHVAGCTDTTDLDKAGTRGTLPQESRRPAPVGVPLDSKGSGVPSPRPRCSRQQRAGHQRAGGAARTAPPARCGSVPDHAP